MSVQRKRHTAQFKFQIAVEAIKNDQTVNQLASKHGLHPSQISQWKRQLLDEGATVFSTTTAQQLRNKKPSRPNSMSRSDDSRWNWSG